MGVSTDNASFDTDFAIGDSWYMFLRCSAPSTNAGGWYGCIANAYLDSYPENPELEQQAVSMSGLLGVYGWSCNPAWMLDVDPENAASFFASALLDSNNNLAPDPVKSYLDPLFLPTSGAINQSFGVTPNSEWPKEESGAFNADAILQESFWRRVENHTSMTRPQFFNSKVWNDFLNGGINLSMTYIGMRGRDVPYYLGAPATNPGSAPGLLGLPTSAPKFTVSNRAKIQFGGTQPGGELNEFWFAWKGQVPFIPVGFAAPGGASIHSASGYRPNMQVRLKKKGLGGAAYTVDLSWADFGKVVLRIPPAAQLGMYWITGYRYPTYGPGQLPIYGTSWTSIPAQWRPLISVQ